MIGVEQIASALESAAWNAAGDAAILRVDPDVYHADPCPEPSLSATTAKHLVERSPLHAWQAHPRLGGVPIEPSAPMINGTLMHRMLLGYGPELHVVRAKNWRKKADREERDGAKHEGKIPVLEHQHDEAARKVELIRKRLVNEGVELDGDSEVPIVWKQPSYKGPIWCRALFDHLNGATIYDLKFVESAKPEACSRHIINFGHAIQRAAYVSALERFEPEFCGRADFVLIFAEAEPPHAVSVGPLDATFRQYGERRWSRAVDDWASCLRANRWLGYGRTRFEAPGWLASRMLEDA